MGEPAENLDWSSRWISDWIGTADHEAWSVSVGVRGMTEAQIMRRIDWKLRDAFGRKVASVSIVHDRWVARLIAEHLGSSEMVGFVFRRSPTETLAHLRFPP